MEGYPVVTDEKVRYADIDAFGHLNNVVFIEFFQQVRVAYFERVGLYSRMGRGDRNLVVAETSCRYLAEGRLGDVIQCGGRFTRLGNSSCEMEYRLERAGELVADGRAVLVFYDFTAGKSVMIPEDLKQRIREIEATVGRSL